MAEASLPTAKALRLAPGELLVFERGENEFQRLGGGASKFWRRHADSSGCRRLGINMCFGPPKLPVGLVAKGG